MPAAIADRLGPFPVLMAIGVLVNGFGSTATSCLVGLGQGKAVMRAGLAGAACIAVLSPLLVWRFGLSGAGIALCTAILVNCLIVVSSLRERLPGRPGLSIHFGQIVELAKVGVPMAGTVLVKFAVLGVLAIAAARVSVPAAAAHNIATGLVSLTFTAALAVGQAVVPLVSTRIEDARRVVCAGLAITTATLAAICAVIVLAGVPRLFTDDPAVIGALAHLPALIVLVVFAVCYGVLALAAIPVAGSGLTGLWFALAVANLAVVVGQAFAFWKASNL